MKNSHRLSRAFLYFLQGSKTWQFCPDFRPHSHSKHYGFKTEQCIEDLEKKYADDISGQNSGQDSSLTPSQFLQKDKTILPNLTLLVAMATPLGINAPPPKMVGLNWTYCEPVDR